MVPERAVSASVVTSSSARDAEYGYWSDVVQPSTIHTTRPSTTAGYTRVSRLRNGATFCTRSRGSRSYRIWDSAVTRLENRISSEPNLIENSTLFQRPPMLGPAWIWSVGNEVFTWPSAASSG